MANHILAGSDGPVFAQPDAYTTASCPAAIVAGHSSLLGPALGGCRFHPYVDESAALVDVLRLSCGMTYKAVRLNEAAAHAGMVA